MQSETHETLYRSLADITDRVKATLDKNDAGALTGLAEEHKKVMDKLDRTGISKDPGLFDMVKETQDQVNQVIAEIGRQRDELGRQLAQFNTKRIVSTAYTGINK